MPTIILIALPVGIFVILLLIVLKYSMKERVQNKRSQQQTPSAPATTGPTTTIYTIPTIRQLEIMFPSITDVTVVPRDDHLPPPYTDVSAPPPSYDQLQIDFRILNASTVGPEKSNSPNSIT